MSKLDGYDESDRGRIKRLMTALVAGKIERGEIPCTDEAIKAAMPQALSDAKAVVNAAIEYLCG